MLRVIRHLFDPIHLEYSAHVLVNDAFRVLAFILPSLQAKLLILVCHRLQMVGQ